MRVSISHYCCRCLAGTIPTIAVGALALGQDSVSITPGNSDALSPYTHFDVTRYVVDLVQLSSSWGNLYRIAPLLKASADADPMFPTQVLGSAALSSDQLVNLSMASTDFMIWGSPGAGVHPTENTTPLTIAVSGFDSQFAVTISDLSSGPTNIIGATIGRVVAEPSRLYVTRRLAMASRASSVADDTATLSLGAIDAAGNLLLRADGFNAASPSTISGENILRVNLPARSNLVNILLNLTGSNLVSDVASTSYVVDNATITTNTPTILPNSLSSGSLALIFDFANLYTAEGALGTSLHLDAPLAAHRGNPSFSTTSALGGVGTVGSLAKASASTSVSAINLFTVDALGTVQTSTSAILPTPITDGSFSTNAGGQAQFLQYLSQTSFRGANGQVAIGFDPVASETIAAATANDPVDGEFIAVARFPSGQAPSWTIAAFPGKSVLDGPGGSPIGTLVASAPASMSSPAADFFGNIYFVASYQPTVGPAARGLFKAVNASSGYELEMILQEGNTFFGANSSRSYTIDRLTLGDSDSIASGSIFSSSVLQPSIPGISVTGPQSPTAFGGAIVNASIIYNNSGTPETYQAALFIGPDIEIPVFCNGDANGDGIVDFTDITTVLSSWLTSSNPGSGAIGDANNDGIVNFADLTIILGNWLRVCP